MELSRKDLSSFKEWLNLNINNITWEGRYQKEFDTFWESLFKSEVSLAQQIDKIDKAIILSKSGPLVAWFNWLKRKFITHIFISKEITVFELSQKTKFDLASVALVLRDFFYESFPHLEKQISDYFQITHATCDNANLTFQNFAQNLGINVPLVDSTNDEILKSLEVTLYQDWSDLSNKFSLKDFEITENIKKIQRGITVKRQVKFIQDLLLLFFIGGLFIAAVKFGNEWYEKKLVKEITLFEPNFFWLDKEVTYQSDNPLSEDEIGLGFKELEDLERLESQKVFKNSESENRYEVESDVVLTSINSIPKDFTTADLEQSDYEENKKGGYRNVRYGRRKAYRVMMNSESPDKTKSDLVAALKEFNISQVDNVKPGTNIPGGIYFNLHVPRKFLDQFLSRITYISEARILESKTVFRGPKGTNKVFIWIKQI